MAALRGKLAPGRPRHGAGPQSDWRSGGERGRSLGRGKLLSNFSGLSPQYLRTLPFTNPPAGWENKKIEIGDGEARGQREDSLLLKALSSPGQVALADS